MIERIGKRKKIHFHISRIKNLDEDVFFTSGERERVNVPFALKIHLSKQNREEERH